MAQARQAIAGTAVEVGAADAAPLSVLGRVGLVLIALFFAVATVVLLVTAAAMMWPGTWLDQVWHLAEGRRQLLMPYRMFLAPRFVALAVPMAIASAGCFLRRRWGRWLAIAIFALNGLGNVFQFFNGHAVDGVVGLCVTALLIIFLTRPSVKAAFS